MAQEYEGKTTQIQVRGVKSDELVPFGDLSSKRMRGLEASMMIRSTSFFSALSTTSFAPCTVAPELKNSWRTESSSTVRIVGGSLSRHFDNA
jgi:hypothetical protein